MLHLWDWVCSQSIVYLNVDSATVAPAHCTLWAPLSSVPLGTYFLHMYLACTLHVSCMYLACSLHVSCMYPACTLHLSCVYPAYILHVSCMYLACILYVSLVVIGGDVFVINRRGHVMNDPLSSSKELRNKYSYKYFFNRRMWGDILALFFPAVIWLYEHGPDSL